MTRPTPKIHVTADVPVDLVEKVDERVDKLGVTRSFAVRKGLALFLQTFRQDLTEIVIEPAPAIVESEARS